MSRLLLRASLAPGTFIGEARVVFGGIVRASYATRTANELRKAILVDPRVLAVQMTGGSGGQKTVRPTTNVSGQRNA